MNKNNLSLILTLSLFAIAPLNAGWNFRSLNSMQVNVEYEGYAFRNALGDPVYLKGETVRYRVTVKNSGFDLVEGFPIEAGLYWAETASCDRSKGQAGSVTPSSPLPGLSSSGTQNLTIPSGGTVSFEGSYRIPKFVCGGEGDIRFKAGRQGEREFLRVPMRFEIRN